MTKGFEDLKFKELSTNPDFGTSYRAKLQFDNGYGVSVIAGPTSYSSPREYLPNPYFYEQYELAVLKDGNLCYDTEITNDVLGYRSKDEITEVIGKVQQL